MKEGAEHRLNNGVAVASGSCPRPHPSRAKLASGCTGCCLQGLHTVGAQWPLLEWTAGRAVEDGGCNCAFVPAAPAMTHSRGRAGLCVSSGSHRLPTRPPSLLS